MLNPIESLWSSVKAKAKAELSLRREEIVAGPGAQETIASHRLRILESIVESAMSTCGSRRSLYNYTQHINMHLRKALAEESMCYGV